MLFFLENRVFFGESYKHFAANLFGRGTIKKAVALVLILISLAVLCINNSRIVEAQTGNSWVEKAPMPTARFSFGVGVVNGRIYAIGGAVNGSSPLLAVNEEYDPVADKWSEKSLMPTPSYGFATAVFENRIYVFGGAVDNNVTLTNVTLVYDPSTDSWVTKAPMPIARNLMQANVVEGKIYLIGGYPYPFATLNEVYDPATDMWTTKASMPIAAIACASAVVDNKIYVISGISFANATSPGTELSLTQVYDPQTDTWSSGASIPTPLDSAGVGVIIDANGREAIYVVGGETDIFSPKTLVQVYFPENDSWNLGPPLLASRSRLCAAVVSNSLYAIGGTRIIGHQGLSDNSQYIPFGTVPTSSVSPSPAIPEFPALAILPLFISLFFIAVKLRYRNPKAAGNP